MSLKECPDRWDRYGGNKLSDIRLFVCCHRPDQQVPQHPLLYPIQVGAALAGVHFEGFLHDDEGEHISGQNRSYCELTAQYWAWKNVRADYYGFFHYRRYLCPDMTVKGPYTLERVPTEELLEKMGYGNLEAVIHKYDLIVPREEYLHCTVYEHYASAKYHHGEDLQLVQQIIDEMYPEYAEASRAYLSGRVVFYGNIYIMRRNVFDHYCQWLFSILHQFDMRANVAGYGPQEQRVNGYLAERLFGIYYTYHVDSLRVLKVPGVHFYPGHAYWKQRLIQLCVPPSSRRKQLVKRMLSR